MVNENSDWVLFQVLKHSSEMVMELRSLHWEEKSQVLMVLVSSHSAGRELGYVLLVVVLPPMEMGLLHLVNLTKETGQWELVVIEEESGTWEAMEMSMEEETRGLELEVLEMEQLDLGEKEVTDLEDFQMGENLEECWKGERLEDEARTVVEEVVR